MDPLPSDTPPYPLPVPMIILPSFSTQLNGFTVHLRNSGLLLPPPRIPLIRPFPPLVWSWRY